MIDPVEEFIGQQLHSISNVDAGMMPKSNTGKRSVSWWPHQHHKPSKSFNTGSHEDRLIAAIDKKNKRSPRSRQDEVQDLLEHGYRKKEIAEILGVHRNTVGAEVRNIRLKLAWERKGTKKEDKDERGNGKKEERRHREAKQDGRGVADESTGG